MGQRFELGEPALVDLLRHQDGVIALRQLRQLGAQQHDVERMVRRRELRRVHPGVYLDHTGPLTRRQREWVAVLAAWPAALADESVLPGTAPGLVHIAVAPGRKVQLPVGVRMRRITQLDEWVLWHRSPPRVRIEQAVLNVMSQQIRGGDVAAAFATLTRAAQSRETTLERIAAALSARHRLSGRALIEAMLSDLRDGVWSVLERGYRHRVERPHGLPRARRQHPSEATGTPTRQDIRYPEFSLVVELDGHAFHGSAAARDRDATRDLAELASSAAATARVTYGLVFTDPCRTAHWIAEILRRRGWTGVPRRCPRCPASVPPAVSSARARYV
jgi:hypothetical protein